MKKSSPSDSTIFSSCILTMTLRLSHVVCSRDDPAIRLHASIRRWQISCKSRCSFRSSNGEILGTISFRILWTKDKKGCQYHTVIGRWQTWEILMTSVLTVKTDKNWVKSIGTVWCIFSHYLTPYSSSHIVIFQWNKYNIASPILYPTSKMDVTSLLILC